MTRRRLKYLSVMTIVLDITMGLSDPLLPGKTDAAVSNSVSMDIYTTKSNKPRLRGLEQHFNSGVAGQIGSIFRRREHDILTDSFGAYLSAPLGGIVIDKLFDDWEDGLFDLAYEDYYTAEAITGLEQLEELFG